MVAHSERVLRQSSTTQSSYRVRFVTNWKALTAPSASGRIQPVRWARDTLVRSVRRKGVNRGCYWPCSGLIAEDFSKRLISGIDRNGDAKTLGASKFSKLEGVDTDNSSDLINLNRAEFTGGSNS